MSAILDSILSLEEELRFFNGLTDEEAIEIYNVDQRDEALAYIQDYWA